MVIELDSCVVSAKINSQDSLPLLGNSAAGAFIYTENEQNDAPMHKFKDPFLFDSNFLKEYFSR